VTHFFKILPQSYLWNW